MLKISEGAGPSSQVCAAAAAWRSASPRLPLALLHVRARPPSPHLFTPPSPPCPPPPQAILENAHGLARYAQIAQAAGLVPIVEPEVRLLALG